MALGAEALPVVGEEAGEGVALAAPAAADDDDDPAAPATTGFAAAVPPPVEALDPATSSACDPALVATSSAYGIALARRSASASCGSAWGSSSGSENGEPSNFFVCVKAPTDSPSVTLFKLFSFFCRRQECALWRVPLASPVPAAGG